MAGGSNPSPPTHIFIKDHNLMREMEKLINLLKNEPFLVYGAGIVMTILSWIYFTITGYPLVITVNETLSIYAPPIYMLPLFFPYGILIGELTYCLFFRKNQSFLFYILLIECILTGGLSFIRLFSIVPFSGHALIIFFYLFHQVFNNHYKFLMRIIFGLVVLIIVIIFKFFIWNDPITFLIGSALGIIFWIPGYYLRRKYVKKEFL